MTVLVKVMLKSGVLDPQGKAIADALHRLGYGAVRDVRAGKLFRIEVDTDSSFVPLGAIRARSGTCEGSLVPRERRARSVVGIPLADSSGFDGQNCIASATAATAARATK